MKFTDEALALLKRLEGCRLEAYPDPATGGDPWTIGYGCTAGVKQGMKLPSEAAACDLLSSALVPLCAKVRAAVHPSLSDNQFSAAVLFAFNMRNWESTPLFRLLKEGDFAEAEAHWVLYDKATVNGQKVEVAGLKNRRQDELELFAKAC